MLEASNSWIEFVRFVCEAQSVILMRLVRLSQGGADASLEAQRMVAEKFDALAEAEAAMADALAHGEALMVAAERAYAPVRQRVHANSCRLMAPAA
jgi:thioesterase domain-containing protein